MSFWDVVIIGLFVWTIYGAYRGRGPIGGTVVAAFRCAGMVVLISMAAFLGIIGMEAVRHYDEQSKGQVAEKVREAQQPYYDELWSRDPQAKRFTESHIEAVPGRNRHF